MKPQNLIHIVGAGLAGTECALQLAHRGYQVRLFEMRSKVMTPAHKTGNCAELVCSNSFGSYARFSAPGQMKWEAEQLGSKVLEAAFRARVPAGQALGIDRDVFSASLTEQVRSHPNIELVQEAVESIADLPRPLVIATGPLTHEKLAESLQVHFGNQFLYFFDAIAPIIDADTIDMNIAWRADRWNKGAGDGDYINCPLNKEQYETLMDEITAARKVEPKEFEKDTPYFESCMPIEELVRRGRETLRFGPMSPKGLFHPETGDRPWAVVQLRQDNKMGTAYNIVGFQTKMAYPEQKRIFRMIPGLENAEFLKLGSIHRNLYIHSPSCLGPDLSSRKDPWLFFAGQITGVEGYFESTCTGMLVARFLDQKLRDRPMQAPPRNSALGSILAAVTEEDREQFQPTNINFGLMPPAARRMGKAEKKVHHIQRARLEFSQWLREQEIFCDTEKFTDQLAEEILTDKDRYWLERPIEISTASV